MANHMESDHEVIDTNATFPANNPSAPIEIDDVEVVSQHTTKLASHRRRTGPGRRMSRNGVVDPVVVEPPFLRSRNKQSHQQKDQIPSTKPSRDRRKSSAPITSRDLPVDDNTYPPSDNDVEKPFIPVPRQPPKSQRHKSKPPVTSIVNLEETERAASEREPQPESECEPGGRKRLRKLADIESGTYNQSTVANDRHRRSGRPKKVSGAVTTIDLVSVDVDTATEKPTATNPPANPPDTKTELAPPRRSPRNVTRSVNNIAIAVRTMEEKEAAQELVDLDGNINTAPYTGPTHLIFVFPPRTRGSIRVTAEELERLKTRKYLNDSLIDFYIKYLETRLRAQPQKLHQRRMFFSSFFFGRMARTRTIDYTGVQSWTKNIDIFSQKYVFVPICDSYHWSLIIVINLCNMQKALDKKAQGMSLDADAKPKIVYLDSLDPERGHNFGGKMCQYLTEEWITRKEKIEKIPPDLRKDRLASFKSVLQVFKPRIPIQSNEYDCGLYLLQCLQMFLENTYSFQDKIVSDYSNLKDAFTHTDIEKLRHDIIMLMSQLEESWKIKGRDCGGVDEKANIETEVDAGSDHQLRKVLKGNPSAGEGDKSDYDDAMQTVAYEQNNANRDGGSPEYNGTAKKIEVPDNSVELTDAVMADEDRHEPAQVCSQNDVEMSQEVVQDADVLQGEQHQMFNSCVAMDAVVESEEVLAVPRSQEELHAVSQDNSLPCSEKVIRAALNGGNNGMEIGEDVHEDIDEDEGYSNAVKSQSPVVEEALPVDPIEEFGTKEEGDDDIQCVPVSDDMHAGEIVHIREGDDASTGSDPPVPYVSTTKNTIDVQVTGIPLLVDEEIMDSDARGVGSQERQDAVECEEVVAVDNDIVTLDPPEIAQQSKPERADYGGSRLRNRRMETSNRSGASDVKDVGSVQYSDRKLGDKTESSSHIVTMEEAVDNEMVFEKSKVLELFTSSGM